MATGRTVSADILTRLDEQVLDICEELSDFIVSDIKESFQSEFKNTYAKISRTRDARIGVGGGKLQRDALCTRGRQGKAPFSNRNFRWHPLVAADQKPAFAEEVGCIEVEEETLVFIAGNPQRRYPSGLVHTMPRKFVVLPTHWFSHLNTLRYWGDTQWTQNSCVISAMEAANWWDAVESYAVLGMSIAINFYEADFQKLYVGVVKILRESKIGSEKLPSDKFPKEDCYEDITACPVCKKPVNSDLSEFRKEERVKAWEPAWSRSKKGEGDDSSIQIMHVAPLVESQMRHNAENVRYGHRWCNVAMTDHSLEETLDFMQHVVNVHRGKE